MTRPSKRTLTVRFQARQPEDPAILEAARAVYPEWTTIVREQDLQDDPVTHASNARTAELEGLERAGEQAISAILNRKAHTNRTNQTQPTPLPDPSAIVTARKNWWCWLTEKAREGWEITLLQSKEAR